MDPTAFLGKTSLRALGLAREAPLLKCFVLLKSILNLSPKLNITV